MKEYLIDKATFNKIYEKILAGYVFHQGHDDADVAIKFISLNFESEIVKILKSTGIELRER